MTNELSSIERMIQELMLKREDKLYELEDKKAEAEITQQQINVCRKESIGRLEVLKKRYVHLSPILFVQLIISPFNVLISK